MMTDEPKKNHWYEMYELECLKTKELEAQVEKMKCCGNCKYNYCSTSSTIEKDGKILLHKWNEEKRAYCDCGNGEGEKYQLWEIKENDRR